MANWGTTPTWTPFSSINGGEEFSNNLSPEDLNKLAENIAYLYAHQGENEYLGDYADGNYRAGAIVKYTDGNIYMCIKDTDDQQEPTNATYWVMLNEKGSGGTDSALPIEVSSEIEMTALLSSGTVGGVYKYTGTTGTYENGALYVLEEEAVTEDELAGTWVFGSNLVETYSPSSHGTYNVNFSCNGVSYTSLRIDNQGMGVDMYYGTTKVASGSDYDYGKFTSDNYKTIVITSNLADVTNGDALLTWLQANATKQ